MFGLAGQSAGGAYVTDDKAAVESTHSNRTGVMPHVSCRPLTVITHLFVVITAGAACDSLLRSSLNFPLSCRTPHQDRPGVDLAQSAQQAAADFVLDEQLQVPGPPFTQHTCGQSHAPLA